MREVYALKGNWHCTLTDEAVTIHSDFQPAGQVIKFATLGAPKSPPRYWSPASLLKAAPVGKPLAGLHIAIDPGHLGGKWALMEERWYQMGTSKPVAEGDMTLRTARVLKPQLEQLGAKVTLVRETTEPVTDKRPEDFRAYAERRMPGAPETELRKAAEKLFYRTSEIRARAKLVNGTIKPDLILCLHFNAENWGSEADAPRFSPRNHFHMILHGAYMEEEIAHEDERFEMMHKIFQEVHEEEVAIATELAKSFRADTKLPNYIYLLGKPTIRIGPGLWARNLLANRLYQCPVLFFEPYVMNNRDVHARVQVGDYEGEKDVNGKLRKSIYREYAQAVVNGLVNYYETRMNISP
jgi:N-acetylmuramoyl-L-alanine amidase